MRSISSSSRTVNSASNTEVLSDVSPFHHEHSYYGRLGEHDLKATNRSLPGAGTADARWPNSSPWPEPWCSHATTALSWSRPLLHFPATPGQHRVQSHGSFSNPLGPTSRCRCLQDGPPARGRPREEDIPAAPLGQLDRAGPVLPRAGLEAEIAVTEQDVLRVRPGDRFEAPLPAQGERLIFSRLELQRRRTEGVEGPNPGDRRGRGHVR